MKISFSHPMDWYWMATLTTGVRGYSVAIELNPKRWWVFGGQKFPKLGASFIVGMFGFSILSVPEVKRLLDEARANRENS